MKTTIQRLIRALLGVQAILLLLLAGAVDSQRQLQPGEPSCSLCPEGSCVNPDGVIPLGEILDFLGMDDSELAGLSEIPIPIPCEVIDELIDVAGSFGLFDIEDIESACEFLRLAVAIGEICGGCGECPDSPALPESGVPNP